MGEGGCSVGIMDPSSHFEIIFNESQGQEETFFNTA